MHIEISFEVFKALTVRRHTETTSYDDVLRELLQLPGGEAQQAVPQSSGLAPAGRPLPNGTQLSARYKGKPYSAEIKEDRVWSAGGKIFRSLSAAARDITGTSVNGLTFWKAKRPGDTDWTIVSGLPKLRSKR